MTGQERFEAHFAECERCRSTLVGLCEVGVDLLLEVVRELDPRLGPRSKVMGVRLSAPIESSEARRQLKEAGLILEGACKLAATSGLQSGIFLAALAKTFGAGLGHYHQELAQGQRRPVDEGGFQTDLVRWFHCVATEAVHHLRCQAHAEEESETPH